MHMQMPDRVLGEHMEPEHEIPIRIQVQVFDGFLLESGEDGGADRVRVGGMGRGGEEFGVLVEEGFSRAGEESGFAGVVGEGPEVEEVGVHFLEEEAGVFGGVGVDDVVDAGAGDDEGVGEALTFGAFFGWGQGVLAAVVGGHVADYVGVGG